MNNSKLLKRNETKKYLKTIDKTNQHYTINI